MSDSPRVPSPTRIDLGVLMPGDVIVVVPVIVGRPEPIVLRYDWHEVGVDDWHEAIIK